MHVVIQKVGQDGQRTVLCHGPAPATGHELLEARLPLEGVGPQAWLVTAHKEQPDLDALAHGNFPNSQAFRKFCASKGWKEGSAWEWAHKMLQVKPKLSFIGKDGPFDLGHVETLSIGIAGTVEDKFKRRIKELEDALAFSKTRCEVGDVVLVGHVFMTPGAAACQRELDARAARIKELDVIVAHEMSSAVDLRTKVADQEKQIEQLTRSLEASRSVAETHSKNYQAERATVQALDAKVKNQEQTLTEVTLAFRDCGQTSGTLASRVSNLALERAYWRDVVERDHGSIVTHVSGYDSFVQVVVERAIQEGLKRLKDADDRNFAALCAPLGLNAEDDNVTWATVRAAVEADRPFRKFSRDLRGVLKCSTGESLLARAEWIMRDRQSAVDQANTWARDLDRRHADLTAALGAAPDQAWDGLVKTVATLRESTATRWSEADRRKVLELLGSSAARTNVVTATEEYLSWVRESMKQVYRSMGVPNTDPTWAQLRERAERMYYPSETQRVVTKARWEELVAFEKLPEGVRRLLVEDLNDKYLYALTYDESARSKDFFNSGRFAVKSDRSWKLEFRA